jgi:tRNA A-37 threonylcarbamoyl transferase component Bud32
VSASDDRTPVQSAADAAAIERSTPFPAEYEGVEPLDEGGMGVVYKARDRGLNRDVALKAIKYPDPKFLSRFKAEAEALAAVSHPHVVAVLRYGEHAGRPFLAMEFLPGGSLAGKLERLPDRRLPPADAAALVEKVARGVQAAHEQGIVHRDLKPANVLFDGQGEPKVTDFGIAKRAGSNMTRTRESMGTPNYMAPEQADARAKYVGPAADVWALGVVLYECLTGTRPFHADDTAVVVHRVLNDQPTPPRRLLPSVPRDLETITLKCLEKAPGDRYPTADDLADDLRAFLKGFPVSARPVGLATRTWKWVKRHPARTMLITAFFVAGSAVGMLAPRYGSIQDMRAGQTPSPAGVRVERVKDAEAMFAVGGQAATVFKYIGGPVDFWIELTTANGDPCQIDPGPVWRNEKDWQVQPDQSVEGIFVWIRGEGDEEGHEEWRLGHQRWKKSRTESGGEVYNRFASVYHTETKGESDGSIRCLRATYNVWPPGRYGSWKFESGSVYNHSPSDQPVCLLQSEGGVGRLPVKGEDRPRAYIIRVMCQVVDREKSSDLHKWGKPRYEPTLMPREVE